MLKKQQREFKMSLKDWKKIQKNKLYRHEYKNREILIKKFDTDDYSVVLMERYSSYPHGFVENISENRNLKLALRIAKNYMRTH